MTKITGTDAMFRHALSRTNHLMTELRTSVSSGDIERAIGLKLKLQAATSVLSTNQKGHLLFENKLLQEMR